MDADRRKMSVGDWLKITIPAITLAMAGVGGYYDLKADVMLQNQRIEQETKGYYVVQQSLHSTLQELRVELAAMNKKLDCLADKRFCR